MEQLLEIILFLIWIVIFEPESPILNATKTYAGAVLAIILNEVCEHFFSVGLILPQILQTADEFHNGRHKQGFDWIG